MGIGQRFYEMWRIEFVLIRPMEWQRSGASDPWLSAYDLLDPVDASDALETIARDRQGMALLRRIADELYRHVYDPHAPAGSDLEARQDERRLHDLAGALGDPFSERGHTPDFARLYICRRRLPASQPRSDLDKQREPFGPAPTETSHWVVVQALTVDKQPVRGVRVELVFAGGEVRSSATGDDGCMRVEGIRAARVIIRVLSVDGSMWRPIEGESAEPSSQTPGISWHETKQGECMTKIAHLYGIASWKLVWERPENERLRKRRTNPHVLLPGDMVAVPRPRVYEIVRPTDATQVIEINRDAHVWVRVRLQDRRQRGFSGLIYELSYLLNGTVVQRAGNAPTAKDGLIEERVPIGVDAVVITVEKPQLAFRFVLGELDPAADEHGNTPQASGVRARLRSLGYPCAPGDNWDSDAYIALAEFQRDILKREGATGEPDSETCAKLAELYGA